MSMQEEPNEGNAGDPAFDEREGAASSGGRTEASVAEGLTPEEQGALARAFAVVRRLSGEGRLAEPACWEAEGLVPADLTAEEFEMLVYEYWEERQGGREEQAASAVASAPKEAGRRAAARPAARSSAIASVGVPPFLRRAEQADGGPEIPDAAPAEEETDATEAAGDEAACTAEDAVACGVPEEFAGLKLPEGYRLAELEGEWVLVPAEEVDDVPPEIDCDGIEALVGRRGYYLYDRSLMTDNFAHWAFLAAEDDDIVTFVDCVREESRVYPRPMATEMLKNDPFGFSDERIERAWEAVRASGEYPDIERTEASNGDVYYFSTRHLSRVRAEALAEWASVERARNV